MADEPTPQPDDAADADTRPPFVLVDDGNWASAEREVIPPGDGPDDAQPQAPPPGPANEPVGATKAPRSVARQHRDSSHCGTLNVGGDGYPYVILGAETARNDPQDRYTLETADGSYRESRTFGAAKPGAYGAKVLWFPVPPDNSRCRLLFEPAVADDHNQPYYIFTDQPATYVCDPPPASSGDDSGGG